MNVLITSAGRRVSLVTYFQEMLRARDKEGSVYTTDLEVGLSPACRKSDIGFNIGSFRQPSYINDLLAICKDNDVRLVVPTIDTELLLYAEHRKQFADDGIMLLVSSPELVNQCRDKRLTTELFHSLGIDTPREVDLHNCEFPIFVKPIGGSSSQNIFVIRSANEIPPWVMDTEKFIHQEYFSPKDYREFTVDLYYDRNSKLRCAVPRLRIATRSGEISKGITIKGNVYSEVLKHFQELPGAIGCITLQVFERKADGKLFGIEINPRFGGGYPLSHLAGANYVDWIIAEYLLNAPIPSFCESWKEDTLLLRYDAEMIVHDYAFPK